MRAIAKRRTSFREHSIRVRLISSNLWLPVCMKLYVCTMNVSMHVCTGEIIFHIKIETLFKEKMCLSRFLC